MMPVSGQVVTIERTPEATRVLLDDGGASLALPLDQLLISFSAAMEAKVRRRRALHQELL
jgi:hypothetical protein